ncbi:M90 family metallopeptidase [Sphingobacterium suaedae]|uniref:Zinc-dependent peptidase n=1 Tax=Sphingobacterium suaedae TaxID=1686402 RepID=A0ABW5KMM5_9SPHI
MEAHKIWLVSIVFLIGTLLIWYVFKYVGNKRYRNTRIAETTFIRTTLANQVTFFKHLRSDAQDIFLQRVVYFLTTTKISAEKGARITDTDRVLVAASATIPLFHFEKWSYENLDEVILYPGTFNERYDTDHPENLILGMVGDGVMNRKMIISLPSLRAGFSPSATSNTAIHEFVHLIDKADGEVDGIPEYLIPKELIQPWLKEMHRTIARIRHDKSDIRDYAATNEAEFLAVVSEYFFQKPKMLQEDHPALYALLDEIYNKQSNEPLS